MVPGIVYNDILIDDKIKLKNELLFPLISTPTAFNFHKKAPRKKPGRL